MAANMDNLKKVVEDEALMKDLLATEDVAEVQKKLEAHDVSMSTSELETIADALGKVARGEATVEELTAGSEELSDDDLENVSGGFAISATLGLILAGAGAVAGFVGGAQMMSNLEDRIGLTRRW